MKLKFRKYFKTDRIREGVEGIKSKYESTKSKYEGLRPITALQKAASKAAVLNTDEKDYYQLSTKLKDGEKIPERILKENDIYTLKDIKDPEQSKYYKEQFTKMYGVDLNDPDIDNKLKDKKIVVPKESSRLSQYAKNSEALEKWVVANYDRIKNGEKPLENSIEFPSIFKDDASRGLYATIHNTNMHNVNISKDNSLTIDLDDNYDFAQWDDYKWNKKESIKNNIYGEAIVAANNNAYEQQEKGQLENYPIKLKLKYSQEEIEKLMRKYKHIKY